MGASDHGRLNKPKRDAGDVKLGGLGAGIGSLKLLLVPELYNFHDGRPDATVKT